MRKLLLVLENKPDDLLSSVYLDATLGERVGRETQGTCTPRPLAAHPATLPPARSPLLCAAGSNPISCAVWINNKQYRMYIDIEGDTILALQPHPVRLRIGRIEAATLCSKLQVTAHPPPPALGPLRHFPLTAHHSPPPQMAVDRKNPKAFRVFELFPMGPRVFDFTLRFESVELARRAYESLHSAVLTSRARKRDFIRQMVLTAAGAAT